MGKGRQTSGEITRRWWGQVQWYVRASDFFSRAPGRVAPLVDKGVGLARANRHRRQCRLQEIGFETDAW